MGYVGLGSECRALIASDRERAGVVDHLCIDMVLQISTRLYTYVNHDYRLSSQ